MSDLDMHSPPHPTRIVNIDGKLLTPLTNEAARLKEAALNTRIPSYQRPKQMGDTSHMSASSMTAPVVHISPVRQRSLAHPQERDQNTLPSDPPRYVDIESLLIDRALENVEEIISLPDEVGQVLLRQKDQSDEVSKQQECLAKLKEALQKEDDTLDARMMELTGVSQKTILLNEQKRQKSKVCRDLKKGLDDLLTTYNTYRNKLSQVKAMWAKEETNFAKYREKITHHTMHVAEHESLDPQQQELLQQLGRVTSLKTQKTEMLNEPGYVKRILNGLELAKQSEILAQYQKDLDENKQEKETIIQQMHYEEERHAGIEQEIQVLHKRNSAQLTRLKHQLKEVQSRNRQWNEQATLLEQNVSKIRKELEQT